MRFKEPIEIVCPYHDYKEMVVEVPSVLECGCKIDSFTTLQDEAEKMAELTGGEIFYEPKQKLFFIILYETTKIKVP